MSDTSPQQDPNEMEPKIPQPDAQKKEILAQKKEIQSTSPGEISEE